MKILLATYWGLTNMGGIWTYMRQLADKLTEMGHTVTLMGTQAEKNMVYLLEEGVFFDKKPLASALAVRLDSERFPHLWLEHGIYSFELGRFVYESGAAALGLAGYDVIHAQDPIAAYALRRAMKRPVPLVYSVHGALAREAYYEYRGLEPDLTMEAYEQRPIWRYFRRMEQLGATAADELLVSSRWIGGLTAAHGVDEARIHTLPYGINLNEFARKMKEPSPLVLDGTRKVIMYAGRLEYIKGVHVLAAALGRLQQTRRDWVCIIAGQGSMEAELKEQIRSLGLEQQVIFTGRLNNIPAALGSADIYVQPSLQDTQPYSVTEAQLAGLAPIVAGTTGMPEMVKQGETGWIVPPDDPAALAAQLAQLLEDRVLRLRTGLQARSWALSHRSLDGMAEGTLQVYRKAIGTSVLRGFKRRKDAFAPSWTASVPLKVKQALSMGSAEGIAGAFHPADALEGMTEYSELAWLLRTRLPDRYSVPDARTVIL